MKNLIKTSIALVVIIAMAACNKDETTPQSEIDDKIIKDYLAEHSIDATKDSSGLYYLITDPGTGDSPTIASEIIVYYKGYLTNGTVFDENIGEDPLVYGLSGLIKGWQTGIPMLKTGGKETLFIPSALGYGSKTIGKISANSVLIFEIELLGFHH